jgi:hypothetical protein
MAYTATPEVQTYETHVLPAFYDLEFAPGSTFPTFGPGCRNLLPVQHEGGIIAESRAFIKSSDVTPNTNDTICRGMYVWEKTIGTVYYFVVVSDTVALTSKIYTSTDAITWAAVTTLTNYAITPVRFTEFIDATNVKKLVLVDGIEGYVFTTNAAGTKIVDVDFPTPHVPFPVFIDGYLFLAKAGTGDIYNSDLNDPAIWTAGSFISSELYPDDIQALVKVSNYLVAVGTQGCEYFYDAANPTASPLARIDSLALPFGTPFPNSIATSKDMVVMLANSNDGAATLRLIEGTKATQLPCPFIESLQTSLVAVSTTAAALRGWFFRQNNDLFYVFNQRVDYFSSLGAEFYPTYAYSFNTQKWTEFTANTTEKVFPVFYSASTTSSNTVTYIAGHSKESSTGARFNVFFGTFTSIIGGSVDTYQLTAGGASTFKAFIPVIRTTIQDFGSLNRKTQLRFGVDLAVLSSTNTLGYTVSWSDYNYYGDFTVTGYTGNQTRTATFDYPFVNQLGTFRTRVYRIKIDSGAPTQVRKIEVRNNRHMS